MELSECAEFGRISSETEKSIRVNMGCFSPFIYMINFTFQSIKGYCSKAINKQSITLFFNIMVWLLTGNVFEML